MKEWCKMVLYVENIVERLEMACDEWEQFLNTQTGEFLFLPNDFSIDADEELADEIENSDNYIRLPNQYEINEWRIMESFSSEITPEDLRERFLQILHNPKAYRRFKDAVNSLGLDRAYYDYRAKEFRRIAIRWCEDNNIQYMSKSE